MSAYIIVRVDVTDMDQYREYTKLTPATIQEYGGEFVVRGGDVVTLEGESESRRMVVLKFPDVETAQNWYNSEGYQAAIKVREGAADAQFILMNGVD